MKTKTILIAAGVLLLLIGSFAVITAIGTTKIPVQETYWGIIGTYDSYSPAGNFTFNKTGTMIIGTLMKGGITYQVSFNLLPIPPGIPPRPQLLSGSIFLSQLKGTFYPQGQFISGSLSSVVFSGWYSGELQP